MQRARDLVGDWRRRLRLRSSDLGTPAPRIVILLSPQRCGSTWLFDALRCHPAIEPQARCAAFAALASRGRRYPRDLTRDEPDAPQIEVMPGEWAGLPRFELPDGIASHGPAFSIEKIHPHFFFWRTKSFLGRLDQLERSSTMRLIYLVREPGASLSSFLRYQMRDPSWYPHVARAEAARFLWRDLRSLHELARARAGMVVDYADLQRSFAPTLERIFAALGPELAPDPALLRHIERCTAREARPGASAFLGSGAAPAGARSITWTTADLALLAECRRLYAGILRRGGLEPRA